MKNIVTLFCSILLVLLAGTTRAAFPIKKEAAKQTVTTPQVQFATHPVAYTSDLNRISVAHVETTTQKHSFFSKLLNHIAAAARPISVIGYILLSVFFLGWLAIGLNEDWEGNNWWIALILYLLFYFPGLIFSIIMMGKYY